MPRWPWWDRLPEALRWLLFIPAMVISTALLGLASWAAAWLLTVGLPGWWGWQMVAMHAVASAVAGTTLAPSVYVFAPRARRALAGVAIGLFGLLCVIAVVGGGLKLGFFVLRVGDRWNEYTRRDTASIAQGITFLWAALASFSACRQSEDKERAALRRSGVLQQPAK